MMRSLIICAVICIVAALLGWREKQLLSREKEANDKLLKEAATIPSDDAKPPKFLERRKTDFAMDEKVKALTRDYFALLRDYGDNPSAEFAEEYAKLQADLKSRMEELDPAGIKQFMDECHNNPDMNLRIQRDLNNYVQKVFIWKYPIEMARMMSQSPELFGISDKPMPEGVVYDPFEYLIYYYSAEKYDLKTVFQCLAESPLEFQSKYLGQATKYYADSPARRAELLEEMRYFATTPEQQEIVSGQLSELVFGRLDAKGSFIELSDWIVSANLSSEELVSATKDMHLKVRVGETGQWLDWLAKVEMPEELSKERAFRLAAEWTEKDYLAAGQWLSSAPDSPEKSAAVSAYAAKAYPYDPEGAMQWIQTLPQGPDRTKALKTIYQGMPQESDAAQAFAIDNGL